MDDNAQGDQVPVEMSGRMLVGSAKHIAEQIQAKYWPRASTASSSICPAYTPGVIAAVGDVLRPLVGL